MAESPQEQPNQEPKDQENEPSKVTEVMRPLAKEIIKGGLATYAALSDSLSGIGKHFTALVDEAKAEMNKKDPPPEDKSPNDSSP